MRNIKIVGAIIFILSLILAILFNYISKQRNMNSDLLQNINRQKAFTQEVSKTIFYIYNNPNTSNKELDKYIKRFAHEMSKQEKSFYVASSKEIQKQNKIILKEWNKFYLYVQNFRDQSRVTSAYSTLLLRETVNNIYNINLMLVINLNRLIELHQMNFDTQLYNYKIIQYTLFVLLFSLLIYLFTQINVIISFIQKFLHASQNIITKSTIKELEPIQVEHSSSDVLEATNNFNFLVQKINTSIENSATSIQHSVKSLELVEDNIEDLLDLITTMEENSETDGELTKKEDALIQSLEELTTSTQNLKNLKVDLDNLTSHHNSNKS